MDHYGFPSKTATAPEAASFSNRQWHGRVDHHPVDAGAMTVYAKIRIRFVRRVVLALAAVLIALAPARADQPFYKNKSVSLIIASKTPGGYGTYGRVFARDWGAPPPPRSPWSRAGSGRGACPGVGCARKIPNG